MARTMTLVCIAVSSFACAEGSGSYFGSNAGSSAALGGGGGSESSAGSGGSLPEAAASRLITHVERPNPIISRNATVFSNPAANSVLVKDGQYHGQGWGAGRPTAEAPAWVALQLTAGPTRLLVSWDDGGTYDYERPGTDTYGLPAAYRIEVSSNSTNGADGDWRVEADVSENTVRTRGHAVSFADQSWVKLVITAAPSMSPNGVSISEIDVHDISATGTGLPDDTWFFMGDSITAFAYDRAAAHQPSFAAGINLASPTYFPAMINGGIGGETTANGLARLARTLDLNPDYRFIVLGYGTNDAAGGQIPVAAFKGNLQSMIDQIRADGREPVIPHIPPAPDQGHNGIPSYNTAIDELTQSNELIVGADLFAYFGTTSDLFVCPPCGTGRMTDNLHPNDNGLKGMNDAWTSAMRALYP